ncbi:class I SAM-dependent methyltransferase [Flavobacterium poyangense]|uniref:class I SAM-dependent methyltransferase n=1 Tax=Flavobacterium poyangense TaxID=2204302 RepID=UPI001420FB59|nr:class I SAM-dependent methyltransferase [Flavobacterium sp. JXAS1]
MDYKKYTEANRIAWDEVNPIHQDFKKDYKSKFALDHFSTLDENLTEVLNKITFQNKSILQVCCNDGEELISLKKRNAGKCVGIDISAEAINSARLLNDQLGLDCIFHVSDVYEMDEVVKNEEFDIVLVTVGALAWLPSLNPIIEKISKTLVPEGFLVIQEQHPFSWLIEEDLKLSENENYFRKEPLKEEGGLDYLGKTEYEGSANYSFNYTFSDLFNAIADNGLCLYKLFEYANDISNTKEDLEQKELSYPLSYICIAKKHKS